MEGRHNLTKMFHLLYIIGNRNILNSYAFSNISIVITFFSKTIKPSSLFELCMSSMNCKNFRGFNDWFFYSLNKRSDIHYFEVSCNFLPSLIGQHLSVLQEYFLTNEYLHFKTFSGYKNVSKYEIIVDIFDK